MTPNSNAENERWLRFSQGDPAAQTELFVQYSDLVDRVVNQIHRRVPSYVRIDDLRSYGLEGLWNAMRGFDVTREASFETYARIRIRGAILDELRRADDQSRTQRLHMRQAQAAYGAQSQVANPISLDADDRIEWIVDDSIASPEEAAIRSGDIQELNRAILKLSEQEQLVLALVFNEGLTLAETAEVMDLSRSRVSAIYNQALKRLKGMLIRRGIKK